MGGQNKINRKKKLPMNLAMNTYELNKIAYAKLPILAESSPERGAALGILDKYLHNNDGHYFMLLNNDAHYYTIFNMCDNFEESYISALDDCIRAIGDLISIEYNELTNACECWFKIGDEAAMYIFFVYDTGVIECHK
jgi:hypothetical protein